MDVIWYTAMSMDGRIAAPGDDLAFLETIGVGSAPPEDEFNEFLAGIDAVLIGGSTLRWLVAHGHGWPHGDLPTWLLSRDAQLRIAVGEVERPIHQREGDVRAVLEEMEAAGHERVWLCGGGDVAGQLLAIDRIDEVIATIAPTALGAGPALFDAPDLPPDLRFTLEEVRRYAEHAARLVWRRARDGGE
jgi:riboflavin biosynthesis pyrimidine reductase